MNSREQLKIFAYKLFLFSLLGLVLLILTHYFIDSQIRSSAIHGVNEEHINILNYDELVDHRINANIVIFGSSRSKYGINPKYLDDEGKTFYNFSFNGGGASFYKDWYEHIFKPYYPKPDVVILEAGARLDGSRPLEDGLLPLRIFIDKLTSLDFPVDFKSMLKRRSRTPYLKDIIFKPPAKPKIPGVINGKRHLYYRPEIPYFYRGNAPGQSNLGLWLDDFEWEYSFDDEMEYFLDHAFFRWKDPLALHRRNYRRALVEALDAINRIRKDKIKIILVAPPLYHLPGMRPQNIDFILTTLQRELFEPMGIPFLDYNGDRLTEINYDPSNFLDPTHLSISGSIIFSKQLKRDLDQLLSGKIKH